MTERDRFDRALLPGIIEATHPVMKTYLSVLEGIIAWASGRITGEELSELTDAPVLDLVDVRDQIGAHWRQYADELKAKKE